MDKLYCTVMVHTSIVKTFASAMKQADLLKSFSIDGPFNSASASAAAIVSTPSSKTDSAVGTAPGASVAVENKA